MFFVFVQVHLVIRACVCLMQLHISERAVKRLDGENERLNEKLQECVSHEEELTNRIAELERQISHFDSLVC